MKKFVLLLSLLALVACPQGNSNPTALDAAAAVVVTTATASYPAAVEAPHDPRNPVKPPPKNQHLQPRLTLDPAFAHFAAQSTFVYKPGSVPTGIIYADWPSTAQAIKLSPGPRALLVDDSLAPAHMTAGGPYDLDTTTIIGLASATETLIIDSGATFTSSSLTLANGLIISSNATSSPWTPSNFFSLYMSGNSTALICNVGAAPFLHVPASASGSNVNIDSAAFVGDATHHVITVDTATQLIVEISGTGQGANVRPHALTGAGTYDVGLLSQALLSSPQDVTGTLTTFFNSLSSQTAYTPAVPGNWSPVPSLVAPALDQLAARTTGTILTPPTDVAAGSTISIVHAGANNFVGFDGTAITYQLPATLVAGDVVQVKMAQTGATPSIITARGGANIEAIGNPGNLVGVNGSTSISGQGACTRLQLDISTLSGAGVWRVAGSC